MSLSNVHRFAKVAEMVSATRRRKAKLAILGAYLGGLAPAELLLASRYFAEAPLDERVKPGWRLADGVIVDALCLVSGWPASYFEPFFVLCRGWGGAAYEVFHGRGDHSTETSLEDLDRLARQLSETREQQRQVEALATFVAPLSALEMKYVLKVLTRQLLIGVSRRTVVAAIAQAFGKDPAEVRKLEAQLGDVGALSLVVRQAAAPAPDRRE